MSSPRDALKCIECGYTEDKHGDNAECDCCEKRGNLIIYGNGTKMMLLTRECMEREKTLLEREVIESDTRRVEDYQSPEKQAARLEAYKAIINPYDKLIGEARKIDEQLHLDSDIFTAKTIPVEEVRKAIWANPDIPQDKKFFEFVAYAKQHIKLLGIAIFDLDKQKIDKYSEQKAWHVAMNDYANKLRVEEKQQLKIDDNTYDIKMPKPVTPKAIKTKLSTVSDKKALRDATAELNRELVGTGKEGIAEFTVTMLMTSKNWDLEKTMNFLRKTLKEGLSESKP